MTPAALPSFADDPPSPARALVERQLGLLTRLADIGMEIAEAAGRRAVAALDEGKPDDARDATLAYDRAARAVRLTIALQARLLGDLPDLEKAEARARSEKTNDRVNRIHRIVERALEADPEGGWDWRRSAALRERLRDRDDYGALLKLSLGEAVARICKDLGLSPDWSGLLVEGWADVGADEKSPSSSGVAQRRPEDPAADTPTLRRCPSEGGAAGSSGLRPSAFARG